MKMDNEEIKTRLLFDLSELNMPVDEVDLVIRPFSKTFYGRYFPVYDEKKVKPKIHIYPFQENGELIDYDVVLAYCGIHELCHHIQHTNTSWQRLKGIAHDPQFWQLYNHYVLKAIRKGLIGGDKCEIAI